MRDYFTEVLNVVERQGVTCNVVLYTLTLGAQDAITGLYACNYVGSVIAVLLEPLNVTIINTGVGKVAVERYTGYSKVAVNEGDVIVDVRGNTYKIISCKPFTVGDQTVYTEYELVLARLDSTYSTPPTPPIFVEEPIDWAYFKCQGEVWLADPYLSDGGGYFPDNTGEVYFDDPIGYEGGANQYAAGGAYFNR